MTTAIEGFCGGFGAKHLVTRDVTVESYVFPPRFGQGKVRRWSIVTSAGQVDRFSLHSDKEGQFFRYVQERLRPLTVATEEWVPEWKPVSSAAERTALRLLQIMGKPSSVYPSMAPDGDGGVSVVWRAGLEIIMLEVDADGRAVHCTTSSEDGSQVQTFRVYVDDPSDQRRLTQTLDRLSARVRSQNPHWRSAFSS